MLSTASLVWLRSSHTRSMQMFKVFAFMKDASGATAIEYGLIAAGISVVIIAAVSSVGSNLNATFTAIAGRLNTSP